MLLHNLKHTHGVADARPSPRERRSQGGGCPCSHNPAVHRVFDGLVGLARQSQGDGFPAASPGGISAISSRNNRSSNINLPISHRVSAASGYGADDDPMYDNMLEVCAPHPPRNVCDFLRFDFTS